MAEKMQEPINVPTLPGMNEETTAPPTSKSITVYSNGECFQTYTGPIEIISQELGIIKFKLNRSLITVNVPNGIIIVAETEKK